MYPIIEENINAFLTKFHELNLTNITNLIKLLLETTTLPPHNQTRAQQQQVNLIINSISKWAILTCAPPNL